MKKISATIYLTAFLTLLFSLVSQTSCSESPKNITIIHHNDFHAANVPFQTAIAGDSVEIMGLAGLKGLADAVRDTCAPSLWLDAGDEFTGTPVSSITKGASQIFLIRMMGIDAAVLGNHEFDNGFDRAIAFRDSIGIPVLGGANCVLEDGTPVTQAFLDTTIGGVPVRIIGLVPPDLKTLVLPQNTAGLTMINQVETVRRYLPPKNRLAIVLSHMGYAQDSLLATEVPEIDVIIGGHTHTVIHKPHLIGQTGLVESANLKGDQLHRLPGTLILQAGSRGMYLGVLSLIVKNGDVTSAYGQLILNDGSRSQSNPDITVEVDKLEDEFTKMLDNTVAVLTASMERIRNKESNIGRWVTDAYKTMIGTDISLMNISGIRKDLNTGEITIRDIWEVSPFGNTLIVFDISGDEIKRMIEYQIRGDYLSLIFSGLQAEIDASQNSIQKLTINGVALDENQSFRAVTNSYIYEHFHNYFGFDRGVRNSYDTGILDRDALLDYAREQKAITPPEDERWQFK